MRKLNDLNGDYKRRDEIIFGSCEPEKYSCGYRSFKCGRETIQTLLDEGFIDPNECQNDSPFTHEFMYYTEDFADTTFICYAISPDRGDYRVTIDGVEIVIKDDDYEMISRAVEMFHYADEFSFDHVGNEYHLRAWWD